MSKEYVYIDDECGITIFDHELKNDRCPVCGCDRELIEENEINE